MNAGLRTSDKNARCPAGCSSLLRITWLAVVILAFPPAVRGGEATGTNDGQNNAERPRNRRNLDKHLLLRALTAADAGEPVAAVFIPEAATFSEGLRKTTLGRLWADSRFARGRHWVKNRLRNPATAAPFPPLPREPLLLVLYALKNKAPVNTPRRPAAAAFVVPEAPGGPKYAPAGRHGGAEKANDAAANSRPLHLQSVLWTTDSPAGLRFGRAAVKLLAALWRAAQEQSKTRPTWMKTFTNIRLDFRRRSFNEVSGRPDKKKAGTENSTPWRLLLERERGFAAAGRPAIFVARAFPPQETKRQTTEEPRPEEKWRGVESMLWTVACRGRDFEERLLVRTAGPEAKKLPPPLGVRLLSVGLRMKPRPWTDLLRALPGGREAVVVAQADRNKPDGPSELFQETLRALERRLRGKKWTRRFGGSPDALSPKRFLFLTKALEGSFGAVVGGLRFPFNAPPSLTLGTLLADGRPVETLKARLLQSAAGLGAVFSPVGDKKETYAAEFKGRSIFPAPMMEFTKRAVRLYSTPEAQRRCAAALIGGHTVAADWAEDAWLTDRLKGHNASGASPAAPAAPAGRAGRAERDERLRRAAFLARVHLARILPLAYTAWLLSASGPRLGPWRVPGELLPSPTIFRNRLGAVRWAARREPWGVVVSARGPFPGAAPALPVLLEAAVRGKKKPRPAAKKKRREGPR